MSTKSLFFGLYHTLGDVITTTAITRELKKKYPDSKLTYAVGAQYVDVLKGNPDIDEIIPCQSHWEVMLRSEEKQYDRVYIPMQMTQEDSVWHQRPPWCINNGENHNLVDFYASRCNDDITITDRRTFIYPTDADLDEITKNIPDGHKEAFLSTPFITVHVTSRNPSKDWPIERFRELCARINAKNFKVNGNRLAIYQIGGNEDPEIDKNTVVPMMGMPILNTAALIKKSLLHIDIDSGPSFVADSLDVPTICIMGATWSNTSGPIGPNVHYIEPEVRECLTDNGLYTPCHSHCLIKPRECKYNVSVDTVYDKVIDLISSKVDGE